jgi:thiamine-phosphate pyrophosphorylase
VDELRLCLVTDRRTIVEEARPEHALVDIVRDCVAAGLRMVQLREKDLGAFRLASLARQLLEVTRPAAARLIVNDRVDVALAAGADGVQRTGTSLGVRDIRTIAGSRLAIGASVHSVTEAVTAEHDGADWIVFGPVFDTPSKRRYGPPQGLGALRNVAGAVRIPVIAIGGITPGTVGDVLAAGAHGIAVISAILSAPSPASATAALLDALARWKG